MLKTLIIYESIHHGNTKKVVDIIGKVLKAKIIKAENVNIGTLREYDLIGFGSGIYYGKFHKNINKLIDKMPILLNKKVFIFSTSGIGKKKFNNSIVEKLKEHGLENVGDFSCKGHNTYGPFKIIGGIAKNRPNEKDLEDAKNFAENLLKIAK